MLKIGRNNIKYLIHPPATKIVNGTKYKDMKANRLYSKAKKISDFIDYDKAMLKGRELLWNDKQMVIGFYIIFSINTELRVSDVLNIKQLITVNSRSL